MDYSGRKKQINNMNEDTIRGIILTKEKVTKKRKEYLEKIEKKHLVQILLCIEFGNTYGYEPVEVAVKKSRKKEKVQDALDSSST